ncbi:hypothetical protein vseg_007064 [Gypsophila vaccaria]
MDDMVFIPSNTPAFGSIEYDYMDHLLNEGCWLQTADGSSFLHPGPSASRGSIFPSYRVPSLEGAPSNNPSQNASKEEQVADSQCQDHNTIVPRAKPGNQKLSFSWEGDELNRILWIEPKANLGPSTTVKDRLILAISQLSDMNRDRDVLIQIWVPVKKGVKSFLTTVEQPHFYQPNSKGLVHYRDVSEKYEFLADENTKQALGLPGRVFLGKVPEWTPDVRLFRQEEYPRVEFAHQYDVRGSIALPVFEKGSGDCLAVVEIILTTQKFNYRPEVDSVCRALETVHLRSSESLTTCPEQGETRSYEAIRPEILTVLRNVCQKHNLPLAQTWASCSQQRKGGCWHSDKNAPCISTIDSSCYVGDKRVMEYHKACSEHHLSKGRGGIVGKAFETSQPCFATDVTEFSKADYPLSHHAKMYGLRGAVAVRVRSIHPEMNDYVLEFYLPTDLMETGLSFHGMIWQTISMVIQQSCPSLQFISDKPTAENENPSWFSHIMNPQKKGNEAGVLLNFGEETGKKFRLSEWSNSEPELQLGGMFSDSGNVKQTSKSDGVSGVTSGGSFPLGVRKAGEKRRTKAQKTVSLQVLRQYFAGSLKDAAENIGVCPTTLKRICRQHGILRWPSRKIKKVGHSLKKLQLVIDSVQGAQGSLQLSSFYTNFPELNSASPQPRAKQAAPVNPNHQSNPHSTTQAEGVIFNSGTTTSNSGSTSSSHTSTSSHCFPSVANMSPPVTGGASEDHVGSFKRARSEAELQILAQKEHSTTLETSLCNRTQAERLPLEAKSRSWRNAGVFKAKVAYRDEKARFTVVPNMSFHHLQQEIAKRFHLVDLSKIGIKYLDDDREWVLLTCDADLEECISIHRESGCHTIKLNLSHFANSGSSLGSSGFF